MSKTPSIAVIPSGYKGGVQGEDGTVYSVLPTNGDADLEFTRDCKATRVNQNGLIEEVLHNIPRLDYSDGGCPSLLLEPQRTNYVTNSIVGTFVGSVNITNKVVSPSGLIDATTPIPTTPSNRFEYVLPPSTFETDDVLTYSWYGKRISTPTQDPNFLGDLAIGTLVNLEVEGLTEQIESDINGFGRFQVRVKVIDGSIESRLRAYFGGIIGVGNSSVVYYGHQLEKGSYATSLIYTSGTEVTRFKDEASKDNLESYINSSEGVLYAEAKWSNSLGFDRINIFSKNSSGNFTQIRSSDTNSLQVLLYRENVSQASYSVTLNTFDFNNEYIKIAVSYKLNDTKLFVNGSQFGSTDTTCSMPIGLDKIEVQQGITAKDLRVYNEALTDAELITLTQ
jgi:hypothetical protein